MGFSVTYKQHRLQLKTRGPDLLYKYGRKNSPYQISGPRHSCLLTISVIVRLKEPWPYMLQIIMCTLGPGNQLIWEKERLLSDCRVGFRSLGFEWIYTAAFAGLCTPSKYSYFLGIELSTGKDKSWIILCRKSRFKGNAKFPVGVLRTSVDSVRDSTIGLLGKQNRHSCNYQTTE